MNNMFRDCTSLISLNLENFDTSKINYFANLFNPLFQQQFYSQLEDYFNKGDEYNNNYNDSKDSISNVL